MGLIDRAAELGGANAPQRAAPSPVASAPGFDLDYRSLAAQGLYTPGDMSSALALELRVIKRRLLRRLGFRRRGGADRLQRQQGRQRNTILVTSTRAGEGKTFTAISLALSLAAEDEIETLLVDADAPRPKVRNHFRLPEGLGLVDAMRDPAVKAESLVRRARQAPLGILGEGAPVERADALFSSDAAQGVFTALSTHMRDRLVFIDAPPVLATTEALILARYADEVVFVVEADATPEPAVAAALDELLEITPNVSLVLNRCLFAGGGTHYGSYERYDAVPARGSESGVGRSGENEDGTGGGKG